MKANIEISVIVPAFNEEKSISETISRLKSTLKDLKYEIIVVSDGSTDKTREIIEKKYDDVVLINHRTNKGYGASLKDGIRVAKYEWIAITDADGTYPIHEIPNLLKYADNYDMIVGARIKKGAKIPAIRKPAKWMLNQLTNYLTKTKIPDINSGLRVFRKDIAQRFESLFPDGFSFTTTITIATLANGYDIKYVPIEYYKREGKSSISPLRDFVGFTQLIVRIVLYFKPLNFFIPVSLFFLIISMLLAVKDLLNYCGGGFLECRLGLLSIGVFIFAIQIAFLGLIADLVIKRTKL